MSREASPRLMPSEINLSLISLLDSLERPCSLSAPFTLPLSTTGAMLIGYIY